MNEVFPRKWYKQLDRTHWGRGPWDAELQDREQWADPITKYPCLAIRSMIGVWAGYVGVYPDHPLFGRDDDDLPGRINHWGHTDEVHFIEPWPEDPNACVDETDPKGSIMRVVRMPDYLWFFGFDFAHAGDIMPGVDGAVQRSLTRTASRRGDKATYKDIDFVKQTCAKVAMALWTLSRNRTMDSARLSACGC